MPATFPSLRTFPTAATFPVPDDVLSLLNVQKLSLPLNTPLATQVAVSDGFYVSGAGTPVYDGAWFPNGDTSFGAPVYQRADGFALIRKVDDLGPLVWSMSGDHYSSNETDFPWQANWSGDGITLTHPAIQKLNTPNITIVAAYVSGAGPTFEAGIHTDRGTVNGKSYYNLLGVADGDNSISELVWRLGYDNGNDPPFDCWQIIDSNGVIIYVSPDDVAKPWQATFVVNPDIGSSPAPTVTSVTQGELDAGLLLSSGGVTEMNGVWTNRGIIQGFPGYNQVGSPTTPSTPGVLLIYWDNDVYVFSDPLAVTRYDQGNGVAFPWQGTMQTGDPGNLPLPTVLRDDVATEANWGAVP